MPSTFQVLRESSDLNFSAVIRRKPPGPDSFLRPLLLLRLRVPFRHRRHSNLSHYTTRSSTRFVKPKPPEHIRSRSNEGSNNA